MDKKKLALISALALGCVVSGDFGEQALAGYTYSSGNKTITLDTPIPYADMEGFYNQTSAQTAIKIWNTNAYAFGRIEADEDLSQFTTWVASMLGKSNVTTERVIFDSNYPGSYALIFMSHEASAEVTGTPSSFTYTTDHASLGVTAAGWQNYYVTNNIDTLIYTYRTGAEKHYSTSFLNHLNANYTHNISNPQGSYGFVAFKGITNFTGNTTPHRVDLAATHSYVLTFNAAQTETNHPEYLHFMQMGYDAGVHARPDPGDTPYGPTVKPYGTTVKYMNTGYLSHLNFGIMLQSDPTEVLPDTDENILFHNIMQTVNTSLDASKTYSYQTTGTVALKLLAQETLNILTSDVSPIFIYDMGLVPRATNLYHFNTPERPGNRYISSSLFYSDHEMLTSNFTQYEWIESKRANITEGDAYTIYFGRVDATSNPVLKFNFASGTATTVSLFGTEANIDVKPATHRTLLIDNASVLIAGNNATNFYLAKRSTDIGGTLILSNGSKLIFDTSNARLLGRDIILDRDSRIVFKRPISTVTSGKIYAKNLIFYEPDDDVVEPDDVVKPANIAGLFIVEDAVFAGGAVTQQDAVLAVDVENLHEAGNFFDDANPFPTTGEMTYAVFNEAGQQTASLLVVRTTTRYHLRFFYLPSYTLGADTITINRPISSVATAQIIAGHSPNTRLVIKPSTDFSGNSFFVASLTNSELKDETFWTNVKNTIQNHNYITYTGARIPILAVTHTGTAPAAGWTYDLYQFNLSDLETATISELQPVDLTKIFTFTSPAIDGKFIADVGLSYGEISVEARQIDYTVKGPVFASDSLVETLGLDAQTQEAEGSDFNDQMDALYQSSSNFADDRYVLSTKFAACPSAGCADRQVTIKFELPTTIYGVTQIDLGAPINFETSSPLLSFKLDQNVGKGSIGQGYRFAVIYGNVEVAHSSTAYQTGSLDERANAFTMEVRLASGVSNVQRELMWVQPANRADFLRHTYYPAGGAKVEQNKLIGTLKIGANALLTIAHRAGTGITETTLKFAKIDILDSGILSILDSSILSTNAESGTSVFKLSKTDAETGAINVAAGGQLKIDSSTSVVTGDLNIATGGELLLVEALARDLGKIEIAGNLDLVDINSLVYDSSTAQVGTGRWVECAKATTNLVCTQLVAAESFTLNGAARPGTTEAYYLSDMQKLEVTFGNAGAYPVVFNLIRLTDLVAAEDTWYKLEIEDLQTRPTVFVKAQPDLSDTIDNSLYDLLFRTTLTTPLKVVPGFTTPLFTFTEDDLSTLSSDAKYKLMTAYAGVATRSTAADIPNEFLQLNVVHASANASYSLLFPIVPTGRMLTVKTTIDAQAFNQVTHTATLGGDMWYTVEFPAAVASSSLTLNFGGIDGTDERPFLGRANIINLTSLTVKAASVGDPSIYHQVDSNLISHQFNFVGTSPALSFLTDGSDSYLAGNFGLGFAVGVTGRIDVTTSAGILNWAGISQAKPLFHEVGTIAQIAGLELQVDSPTSFHINNGITKLGLSKIIINSHVKFVHHGIVATGEERRVEIGATSDGSLEVNAGGTLEADGVNVVSDDLLLDPTARLIIGTDDTVDEPRVGKFITDTLSINNVAFNLDALANWLAPSPAYADGAWLVVVEAESLQVNNTDYSLPEELEKLVIEGNEIYLKQLSYDEATNKYLLRAQKSTVVGTNIFNSARDAQNNFSVRFISDIALHNVHGEELEFVEFFALHNSQYMDYSVLLGDTVDGVFVSYAGQSYVAEGKEFIQEMLSKAEAEGLNSDHPLIGIADPGTATHNLRGINDHVSTADAAAWQQLYLINHQLADGISLDLSVGEGTTGRIKVTGTGSNHGLVIRLADSHTGNIESLLAATNVDIIISASDTKARLIGQVKAVHNTGAEVNVRVIFEANNSGFSWQGASPLLDPTASVGTFEIKAEEGVNGEFDAVLANNESIGTVDKLAIKAGVTVNIMAEETTPSATNVRWLNQATDGSAAGVIELEYAPRYNGHVFADATYGQFKLNTSGTFKAEGLTTVISRLNAPSVRSADEITAFESTRFLTLIENSLLELNYINLPGLRSIHYTSSINVQDQVIMRVPLTTGTCNPSAPIGVDCLEDTTSYSYLLGGKLHTLTYRVAAPFAEIVYSRSDWLMSWYTTVETTVPKKVVFNRTGTAQDLALDMLMTDLVRLTGEGYSFEGADISLVTLQGQASLENNAQHLFNIANAVVSNTQLENFGGHLLELVVSSADSALTMPAGFVAQPFAKMLKVTGVIDNFDFSFSDGSIIGSLQFEIQPVSPGAVTYAIAIPEAHSNLDFFLNPHSPVPNAEEADYAMAAVHLQLNYYSGVITFAPGDNGFVAAENQLLWQSTASTSQTWITSIIYDSNQAAWQYADLSWTISNAPTAGALVRSLTISPKLSEGSNHVLIGTSGTVNQVTSADDTSTVLAISTGPEAGVAAQLQDNFSVNIQLPNAEGDTDVTTKLQSNLVLFNTRKDSSPLQTSLIITSLGSINEILTSQTSLKLSGLLNNQFTNIEIHERVGLSATDAANASAKLTIKSQLTGAASYSPTLVEARNVIIATEQGAGSLELEGEVVLSAYRVIVHAGSGKIALKDDAKLVSRYLELTPTAADSSVKVLTLKVTNDYLAADNPTALITLKLNHQNADGEIYTAVNESITLLEQAIATTNSVVEDTVLAAQPLPNLPTDFSFKLANLEQLDVVLDAGQVITNKKGILLVDAQTITITEEDFTPKFTTSYAGFSLDANNYFHVTAAGFFTLTKETGAQLYYNHYDATNYRFSGFTTSQFTINFALSKPDAATDSLLQLINVDEWFYSDNGQKGVNQNLLEAALAQIEANLVIDQTRDPVVGFSSLSIFTIKQNWQQVPGFAGVETSADEFFSGLSNFFIEQARLSLARDASQLMFTSLFSVIIDETNAQPQTVSFYHLGKSLAATAAINLAVPVDYLVEVINLSDQHLTIQLPTVAEIAALDMLNQEKFRAASLQSTKATPVLTKLVIGRNYTGNFNVVSGASETYGDNYVHLSIGAFNQDRPLTTTNEDLTSSVAFVGDYTFTYFDRQNVSAALSGSIQVNLFGPATSWNGQFKLENQMGSELAADTTAANHNLVFVPEISLTNYYADATNSFTWSLTNTSVDSKYITGAGAGIDLVITKPVDWYLGEEKFTYVFELSLSQPSQSIGVGTTNFAPEDNYAGQQAREQVAADQTTSQVTQTGADLNSLTVLKVARSAGNNQPTTLCFAASCTTADVAAGSLILGGEMQIAEDITVKTGSIDATSTAAKITIPIVSSTQGLSLEADSLNLHALHGIDLKIIAESFAGKVNIARIKSELRIGQALVIDTSNKAFVSRGFVYVTDDQGTLTGTLVGPTRFIVYDRSDETGMPNWLTLPDTDDDKYEINRVLTANDITTAKLDIVELLFAEVARKQTGIGRAANLDAATPLVRLDYPASSFTPEQIDFVNQLAWLLINKEGAELEENHYQNWIQLEVPATEDNEKTFTVEGVDNLDPVLTNAVHRMQTLNLFSYYNLQGTGTKFTVNLLETKQPFQAEVQVAGTVVCNWNDISAASTSYTVCSVSSVAGDYQQLVFARTRAGQLLVKLPAATQGSSTITTTLKDSASVSGIRAVTLDSDPGYFGDIDFIFELEGAATFYPTESAAHPTTAKFITSVLPNGKTMTVRTAAGSTAGTLYLEGTKADNTLAIDLLTLEENTELVLVGSATQTISNFYIQDVEIATGSTININAGAKLYLGNLNLDGTIEVEVGVNDWDDRYQNGGRLEIADHLLASTGNVIVTSTELSSEELADQMKLLGNVDITPSNVTGSLLVKINPPAIPNTGDPVVQTIIDGQVDADAAWFKVYGKVRTSTGEYLAKKARLETQVQVDYNALSDEFSFQIVNLAFTFDPTSAATQYEGLPALTVGLNATLPAGTYLGHNAAGLMIVPLAYDANVAVVVGDGVAQTSAVFNKQMQMNGDLVISAGTDVQPNEVRIISDQVLFATGTRIIALSNTALVLENYYVATHEELRTRGSKIQKIVLTEDSKLTVTYGLVKSLEIVGSNTDIDAQGLTIFQTDVVSQDPQTDVGLEISTFMVPEEAFAVVEGHLNYDKLIVGSSSETDFALEVNQLTISSIDLVGAGGKAVLVKQSLVGGSDLTISATSGGIHEIGIQLPAAGADEALITKQVGDNLRFALSSDSQLNLYGYNPGLALADGVVVYHVPVIKAYNTNSSGEGATLTYEPMVIEKNMVLVTGQKQFTPNGTGIVAVNKDHEGNNLILGNTDAAIAAYYIDADQDLVQLDNYGTVVGGAYLKNSGNFSFTARPGSSITGEIIFELGVNSTLAQLTIYSGAKIAGQIVSLAPAAQAYNSEISFEADPQNPDAVSVWRADLRETLATANSQASFWRQVTTGGEDPTAATRTINFKSGSHSLVNGGNFAPEITVNIGTADSTAKVYLTALDVHATEANTTYFKIGSSSETDDTQLVINDGSELIIGATVHVSTKSQLVVNDDATIRYIFAGGLNDNAVGELEVTRAVDETLALPSLAIFKFTTLDEQRPTLTGNSKTIFKYVGGELSLNDQVNELEIPSQGLKLILEDDEIRLQLIGIVPEEPEILPIDPTEKLITEVSSQFGAAAGAIAGLVDSLAATQDNQNNQRQRKEEEEIVISARQSSFESFVTLNDAIFFDDDKSNNYWVDGKFVFSGINDAANKSDYITTLHLNGGLRFNKGIIGQLGMIGTYAKISQKEGDTVSKVLDLSMYLSVSKTIYKFVGISAMLSTSLTNYKYKDDADWINADTIGNNTKFLLGIGASYDLSKGVSVTHGLQWAVNRVYIPSFGGDTKASAQWQNKFKFVNVLNANYTAGAVAVSHSLELAFAGSLRNEWSNGGIFTDPHWAESSGMFTTGLQFKNGIGVSAFGKVSYIGFSADGRLTYQVGVQLKYAKD